MSPGKLATWTDPQGMDRLLIVENEGPNRVSEWSSEGRLLREFLTLQTQSGNGYAIDPENPRHAYVPGHGGWLVRFRIDYESKVWTTDAIWPLPTTGEAWHLSKPVFVRVNQRAYLAGGAMTSQQTLPDGRHSRAYSIYRLDGERWLRSAAIIARFAADRYDNNPETLLWHDSNGNGEVDGRELTATSMPRGILKGHGQNWGDDLSFLALNMNGHDVWRHTRQLRCSWKSDLQAAGTYRH